MGRLLDLDERLNHLMQQLRKDPDEDAFLRQARKVRRQAQPVNQKEANRNRDVIGGDLGTRSQRLTATVILQDIGGRIHSDARCLLPLLSPPFSHFQTWLRPLWSSNPATRPQLHPCTAPFPFLEVHPSLLLPIVRLKVSRNRVDLKTLDTLPQNLDRDGNGGRAASLGRWQSGSNGSSCRTYPLFGEWPLSRWCQLGTWLLLPTTMLPSRMTSSLYARCN